MNKPKTPAISFILILASISAGCSTTAEQNNPAEGGFLNAVAGVAGGQYNERIEKREEDLAIEQETNERLERRKRELELESAEIERKIGITKERIVRLEGSVSEAIDQLADAEGERRQVKMELEIARSRLGEFLDELDTSETISDTEIFAINHSLDEYQNFMESLSNTNY